MNFRADVSAISEERTASPRPGYELFRLVAFTGVYFDTGHLLALRLVPASPFGPYTSVWHRSPEDEWRQYIHGVPPEQGCPRYWGSALKSFESANIEIHWSDDQSFTVRMDRPQLEWSLKVGQPWSQRLLNATLLRLGSTHLGRNIPGMPRMLINFPNGQEARGVPQRLYMVTESQAVMDGQNLGRMSEPDFTPQLADFKFFRKPLIMDIELEGEVLEPEALAAVLPTSANGESRSEAMRGGKVTMTKSLKDLVGEAKARIKETSVEEAAAQIKASPNVLILDVREPGEYAAGHIPHALNVPRGLLEPMADLEYAKREPRLQDRNQKIIIHCASGVRSIFAADVLQIMGFTAVESMAGGFTAWQQQGLPVER